MTADTCIDKYFIEWSHQDLLIRFLINIKEVINKGQRFEQNSRRELNTLGASVAKRSLNQRETQNQLKPSLCFPTGASDILIVSVNVFRFGIFVLKLSLMFS